MAVNGGGPVCAVSAEIGAPSASLPPGLARAGRYPLTIVSAGSNDPENPALTANLLRTRLALNTGRYAGRVRWILPYNRTAAYVVTQVAFRFGDEVVDLALFPSNDRVHPRDYAKLALAILR